LSKPRSIALTQRQVLRRLCCRLQKLGQKKLELGLKVMKRMFKTKEIDMQINLSEDDIWMITNAISTDLHSNLELTEDYKKDLRLLLEKLELFERIS